MALPWSRILPRVIGGALVAATVVGWAFGEPEYRVLTLDNAPPRVPAFDHACAGDVMRAAPETMQDPNFRGALILMCSHGAGGAFGLIINRPLENSTRALLPGVPLGPARLHQGGPVAPDQGTVVYRDDGGLRFTSMELHVPFPRTGWLRPPRVPFDRIELVVAGYSGWAPRQLEGEVEAGGWILTDLDLDEARGRPPRGL